MYKMCVSRMFSAQRTEKGIKGIGNPNLLCCHMADQGGERGEAHVLGDVKRIIFASDQKILQFCRNLNKN